ncbi:MAG: hypothetical protein ABIH83_02820 [Candidatus Micrarchaeota archaeon]
MFSLATIITSKTRLAVLELFIKNSELESGVRETARKLNANTMLVRNELLLLQKSGILKSRKVANSIQYSLNNECPAVDVFRQLIEVSENG